MSYPQVGEPGDVDMQVVDTFVWIPTEHPISNQAFLQNSKIWEICQELPIHWMYQSPLKGNFNYFKIVGFVHQ